MKLFLTETTITLVLLALLVILTNPMNMFLSPTVAMGCIFLILFFFLLLVASLFQDRTRDEREKLHHFIAARFSYLCGVTVLVTGIVIESFMNHLTFWLPLALGGMLLGKLFGRLYADKKY